MIFKFISASIILLNIIMEMYILLEEVMGKNILEIYLDLIFKIKNGLNYKTLISNDKIINLY